MSCRFGPTSCTISFPVACQRSRKELSLSRRANRQSPSGWSGRSLDGLVSVGLRRRKPDSSDPPPCFCCCCCCCCCCFNNNGLFFLVLASIPDDLRGEAGMLLPPLLPDPCGCHGVNWLRSTTRMMMPEENSGRRGVDVIIVSEFHHHRPTDGRNLTVNLTVILHSRTASSAIFAANQRSLSSAKNQSVDRVMSSDSRRRRRRRRRL